jgi:hypothetical protein
MIEIQYAEHGNEGPIHNHLNTNNIFFAATSNQQQCCAVGILSCNVFCVVAVDTVFEDLI